MIIADLAALRTPLDSSTIPGDLLSRIAAVVEDLIGASIAQNAYVQARQSLADLPEPHHPEFDYASRTPHVFAQTWVRSLRDIAAELTALANDPVTGLAARRSAAAFDQAFPGVGGAKGAMRVMVAGKDEIYFAINEVRIPVRIDDEAVRDLEAVTRTLVTGLPKETPFRAAGWCRDASTPAA